jgi:hypothetical protein
MRHRDPETFRYPVWGGAAERGHLKWRCCRIQDTKRLLSEIPGFLRDADEICAVLGHYLVLSAGSVPTFRDNLSVPSSRVKVPTFRDNISVPSSRVNVPTFRNNISVPSSRVNVPTFRDNLSVSWSLKIGPIGCLEKSVPGPLKIDQ